MLNLLNMIRSPLQTGIIFVEIQAQHPRDGRPTARVEQGPDPTKYVLYIAAEQVAMAAH
ncbi:MAG TPA: hypothetical protein PLQ13_03745 [Candidatus Krumholzibacteria bacterium]|nr:hypothetical protein [Candidatus Krumholzibacteria bacterium]